MTRQELLGKTIQARLAVHSCIGAIEDNPIYAKLYYRQGQNLREIYLQLLGTEGQITESIVKGE